MTTLGYPLTTAGPADGYARPISWLSSAASRRLGDAATFGGSGALLTASSMLFASDTSIAGIITAAAGLIGVVGGLWLKARQQDIDMFREEFRDIKSELRDLRRRMGGPNAPEPDSTEAEPEKPHGRRRKRPENRPPEV